MGAQENRSGLGRSTGSSSSAFAEGLQHCCRGEGPDRMKRGCFRVSSLGTFVPGVAAGPFGPVGRCVSSADTFSLSLSLSCPSSAPRLTADSPRCEQCSRGWVAGGFEPAIPGSLARNASARKHALSPSHLLATRPPSSRPSPSRPSSVVHILIWGRRSTRPRCVLPRAPVVLSGAAVLTRGRGAPRSFRALSAHNTTTEGHVVCPLRLRGGEITDVLSNP